MIVVIEQLDYAYKKKKVLNGLQLKIENPGIYGLVAPNGSGKTTLMSVMANLFSPQKGSIEILGMNHTDKKLFKKISYLQDNSVLYDYLSAYQHLTFVCDIHSISKSKMDSVIERFEMTSYVHDKVGGYSMGMKQRLLLAIAILPDPDLLLLDEPLNGLDPTSTIIVRETLQQLAKEGKTMLVSSHNLTELDRVTDTIFFLVEGKAIKENLSDHRKETLFIQPENMDDVFAFFKSQQIDYRLEGNWIVIPCQTHSAVDIMEVLFKEKLGLLDFKKEMTGSEKRYKELFEGVVE